MRNQIRNQMIKESRLAMDSVSAVLAFHNIDPEDDDLTMDEQIDLSRRLSAPCAHVWHKPASYKGTRRCTKCGGLQNN
jgi:hypothetical protein